MNDKQFDDLLKQKLEGHSSAVPDNMWERIARGDDDNRKGFLYRRWLLLLLLVCVITGSSYFLLVRRDDNNDIKYKANNHAEKMTAAPPTGFLSNKAFADTLNDNKKSKENFLQARNTKKVDIKRYTGLTNEIKKEDIAGGTKTHSSIADYSETNNEHFLKPDDSFDSAQQKGNKAIKKESDSALVNITNEKQNEEMDKGFKDKFSLEFLAAPAIPFYQIGSGSMLYEQQLQNSSGTKLSYLAGVRLSIKVSKNIQAKIGLHYAMISQRLQFTDSITMVKEDVINKYRSIDVPLLFSYQLPITKTINAHMNAGVVVNLSSGYKGKIPDAYGDGIDINNGVYKSNTGASVFAGFDVSKKMNGKTDVFAEPFLIFRTKSITNNLQAFTQKNHLAGLSLGLRYRLFKTPQ